MPWKETKVIEERIKFIAAVKSGNWCFADLCRDFNISRKTGYKCLKNYESLGIDGLKDKSRKRITQSNATLEKVVRLILDLREEHPSWGPKKLRPILKARFHRLKHIPSETTIGNILRKKGLIKPKKKRQRVPQSLFPFSDVVAPNDVWCVDFKGHFTVGNGDRCDPLTITDAHSRYLLACEILNKTNVEQTKAVFERVFKEHGLPIAIKSDNGAPFASKAIGGLTSLSVWWLKLGIRPERIEPGRPSQNGRHERMHRTLKEETALPPRSSLNAQQRAFDNFCDEFNYIRPHEALGFLTPSKVYKPSIREFPKKILEVAYPTHIVTDKVHESGFAQYGSHRIFFGNPFIGEVVGFEEVSDRHCRLYFATAILGILDLYTSKVLKYQRLLYTID